MTKPVIGSIQAEGILLMCLPAELFGLQFNSHQLTSFRSFLRSDPKTREHRALRFSWPS